MLPLLAADLRSRRWSVPALTAGAFALMLAISGSFVAYGGSDGLGGSFGSVETPRFVSAVTGTAGADLFTARGFLAFGFVHPLFLLLVLLPVVSTGVGAVAGEIDSRRAELLFACPVPRTLFYDTKLVSCAVSASCVLLGGLVGAETGRALSDDLRSVSPWVPVQAAAQVLALLVLVGGAAFALSAVSRTRSTAQAWTVGFVAGGYLLNVLSLLWSPLSVVAVVSPFHHLQPLAPVTPSTWVGSAGLVVAGVVLGVVGRRALVVRDVA